MSLTESSMMELGTQAPDFQLPDTVSGKTLDLAELKGAKGTLIMFICNHCPYVLHVNEELIRIANDYEDVGTSTVAISSNDVENYPQDSPEKMKEQAEKLGYPFPYLYDKSQEVARAYKAECTPDLYLFDENLQLVYRGRLDGSRPGNDVPLTGEDLRAAIDALLEGKALPEEEQKPSAGCNIKWKQ